MARGILSYTVLFSYSLLYMHLMFFIETCLAEQDLPDFYVFGDSIVDNGRKLIHESGLTTGHSPYGIECQFYDNFRFTNGRNVPELIALALKLMIPQTFDTSMNYPVGGVNYASASAGILPETGSALGKNYCMEKQIGFFRETIEQNLPRKYKTTQKLSKHLSDSIFIINIGASDYIHNYLQPNDYNSSRQYKGEEFAQLLTTKLGNHMKELYDLGARKMVVFDIGPLGCLPYIINRRNPRTRCDDDANKLASIFNDKLKIKLKELGEKLHGSTFVMANTFNLVKNMVKNPNDYGLKETRWPCCATQENGTGLCKEPTIHYLSPEEMEKHRSKDTFADFLREDMCIESPPPPPNPKLMQSESSTGKPTGDLCEDRGTFLFWDELHLTQAAYRIIVDKCASANANSGGICSPYNLKKLANRENI